MSKIFFGSFMIQVVLMSTLLASGGVAQKVQNAKKVYIPLNLKNASVLDVFKDIEQKTEFYFSYEKKDIDLNLKLNVKSPNMSVANALLEVSRVAKLKFKQLNNTIHVSPILNDRPKEMEVEIKPAFRVSGTVTSEDGSGGLPGVNILVKGKSIGTVTDVDGQYNIEVPNENDTLAFSTIGYLTQEVPVRGRSAIDVVLELDITQLEEVVVVGYGTTNRKDLTTSVGTVKSKEINERPSATNVVQGIAGKVAGVNVMTNSGKPGGNPTIKIRGTGSINSSNDPLYVVDGVVGVDPTIIDPSVVESIDILKDAASTAIYGSRGANGVVVITTKQGKTGQARIQFDNTVSFGQLARKIDVLNAEESLEVYKRAYEYKPGRTAPNLDPLNVFARKNDLFYPDGTPRYNTDWQDESTRTAVSNIHTLTISGGGENLSAVANISYRNMEGIMLNSYRKQLNGYLNLNWQVNDIFHLKAILNSGGSRENNVDGGTGNLNETRLMLEFLPFMPVKYPDGTYSRKGDYPGAEESENPVRLLNERKSEVGRTFTLGNVTATFDLTDKLELNATFGGQLGSQYNFYYAGSDLRGWGETQGGVATRQNWNNASWTNEDYLTYNDEFGKHSINIVGGASWYFQGSTFTQAGAEGFFDDFFQDNSLQTGTVKQTPQSSKNTNQMNSFFARANYSFADKYFIGGSFRADGSSRFGKNNKYGYFPSFSGAWRISNERFFEPLTSVVSNLKIRGSYGIVGNAEIGNYVTLPQLSNSQVAFNKSTEPAVTLGSIGNPDLKWEKSEQIDIGADMDLFDGRLEVTFDLYKKVTNDLLYNKSLPITTGYTSSIDNIGSIQNKGLELGIRSTNMTRPNFTWSSGFNFSMNRSKVLELNGDIIYPWAGRIMEGRPLNEFYGYVRLGTWGSDEADAAAQYNKVPGDLKYADLNGNGQKDSGDRTVLGNGMPLWESNINNTLTYKGISFYFDLQVMYGNELMNFTRALMENRVTFSNSYASVLNAWTPENQDSYVASLRLPGDGYENDTDSRTIEDGSFLRLRNISLSYALSQRLLETLPFTSLAVSVNLENAYVFTKYKGFDPETTTFDGAFNQGVDMYQYPKPRTLSFSLNIGL